MRTCNVKFISAVVALFAMAFVMASLYNELDLAQRKNTTLQSEVVSLKVENIQIHRAFEQMTDAYNLRTVAYNAEVEKGCIAKIFDKPAVKGVVVQVDNAKEAVATASRTTLHNIADVAVAVGHKTVELKDKTVDAVSPTVSSAWEATKDKSADAKDAVVNGWNKLLDKARS